MLPDILKDIQQIIQDLRYAGVPPRFLECRLDNYLLDSNGNKEQFGKIKEYIEKIMTGESVNFVISGPVGVGKTHLACAMIYEFLLKQGRVWFIPFAEFMRLIRQGRGKPWEDSLSEIRLLERAKVVRVLIFDDVGVNWGSDWDRQVLDEIVNHRYENMNSTIFTTNLGIIPFKDLVGDRTFDRMVQHSRYFLQFIGQSHRKAQP